jgi:hypothetical protein
MARMSPITARRTYGRTASHDVQFCDDAIRVVLRTRFAGPQDRNTRSALDGVVALLLPPMDPESAHVRARDLSTLIFSESDINYARYWMSYGGLMHGYDESVGSFGMMNRVGATSQGSPQSLNAVLNHSSRTQILRRASLVAMTIGLAATGSPGSAARSSAYLAAEPFPCRLTTQELVELLKMPTCFGTARRVVLDHLGNRYGRRFVNHWAFVRFARDQGLDLDFTTPPQRPDPGESVKRMLEILDRPDAK